MTASTPFNYWANNILAGFRHLISSLHFMSHFIFTMHSHTPLPPPYRPSPPQPTISTIPATPLFKVFSDEAHMSGSEIDDPTSSCTHIVHHIHICSMLKEADDPFEMFIPTGPVKRSASILHPPPPPPYNKHNINHR
jgi:hypothetical protein